MWELQVMSAPIATWFHCHSSITWLMWGMEFRPTLGHPLVSCPAELPRQFCRLGVALTSATVGTWFHIWAICTEEPEPQIYHPRILDLWDLFWWRFESWIQRSNAQALKVWISRTQESRVRFSMASTHRFNAGDALLKFMTRISTIKSNLPIRPYSTSSP